jgi:hypothetical protein
MHIEPGIVSGVKLALSYATAAGAVACGLKMAFETMKETGGVFWVGRAILATVATFVFFEILPHFPVGVSEVHFILGSTLFLIFGASPAAFGLATGLLIQSTLFSPADIPQYFMNITSLLLPLFTLSLIAKAIIKPSVVYIDLSCKQVLILSASYQFGVVSWVAFWVFYGQGFSAETLASVGTFGFAYMSVILIEPVIDLAVLAFVRTSRRLKNIGLVQTRVYSV